VDHQSSHRLPRGVTPSHYDLVLTPDLDAATFTGTVTVTIDVAEATDEVVLNAEELEIASVALTTADGETRTGTAELIGDQRAVLHFVSPVPAGTGHLLELTFSGVLNDKLHGFYRSSFVDDQGNTRVIATTQFEPADARRALPCWDEPDFKATFAVTLVVDDELTAISNGDIVSTEPVEGGRRRVRFATTMRMSTYLLAFIVGPFELTEPVDVDGVPLRIAAPPGRDALTPYATEVAVHALRFLAGYFDLAYPHDKIDHVAIPDFAFGAMENLGCVTYRETALLVDAERASQLELQRVATVVAHETAHMWFGDLVTMKWWNGIWLNEAFATFMELTTTHALRPDWDVWTAFGLGRSEAMNIDGLQATRPVEFAVNRPEDAEAMFDVLTYQKGGAVLRMLEQYLGPDVFRRGIAGYLDEHQYGNTETADLWNAIESTSGEPVRQTMDSWILQGGYPLLTVSPSGDGRSIVITQERFLYRGEDLDARWVVPINLRASVGGTVVHHKLLLEGDSATVSFDAAPDWVILNDGAWGFYRVRYDTELLRGLLATRCQGTTPLERMALVADTWALVLSGRAELEDLFAVLRALRDEDEGDVWAAMSTPLRTLDLVVAEEDRPALQAFVQELVGPAFAKVGWDPADGEPPRQGTLRSRLVTALGVLGADPAVGAEAQDRFSRYLRDGTGLSPDVLTAAVNVAVASGDTAVWETVFEQYQASSNPQERIRYLIALTATADQTLLAQLLDATLTATIRTQDAASVIAGVLGSRAGGPLAWEWLTRRWEEIRDRLPSNMLVRVLEGVTALVGDGFDDQVHAWIALTELPIGGPRLAQIEERLAINVALRRRLSDRIAATLRA
jgi:puromycin-sensitive aminopeptidase